MTTPVINCPLCFQPAFGSLAALSMSLINVATRALDCPVCQDSLPGLDKFTIHIFGHALNHQISHKSQENGVIKVVASTSGHDVIPIDIPVYIREIDNDSYVDASNLNNVRLSTSSHDNNNNNNEKEAEYDGNRMIYSTGQECESIKSIITNNDSYISISRDSNISINDPNFKCSNNEKEAMCGDNRINSITQKFVESHSIKRITTNNDCPINISCNSSLSIHDPNLRYSNNDKEAMCGDSSLSIHDPNLRYSNTGKEAMCGADRINITTHELESHNLKRIITDNDSNDSNLLIHNPNLRYSKNDIDTMCCGNRMLDITQEDHNIKTDSSIRSTDSSTCMSSDHSNIIPISGDNLEYSQDNDLLKNLEPYIKYGTEKVDKKAGNKSFGRGNDGNLSVGGRSRMDNIDVMVEDTSNFVQTCKNFTSLNAMQCLDVVGASKEVLDTSNVVQTCKNFTSLNAMQCLDVVGASKEVLDTSNVVQTCETFTSLNAMQCLDVDRASKEVVNSSETIQNNVYNTTFVPGSIGGSKTSSIKNNEVDKHCVSLVFEADIGGSKTSSSKNNDVDKHCVSLVFEAESLGGLQNDVQASKTKSSKKDVKGYCRKICKIDSSMTTQGVQTMEESFTKNNNPFGKFSTADRRNEEDFVQELSVDGNDTVSDSLMSVNSNSVAVENEVCDLCLFSFPDRTILQMHKNLVHGDCDGEQKKTFSCHLCSKSFNMRGSLMVHKRVAHPVLSGGQVSLRNIERIKEMKASNSFDETSSQFSCKICGKSFKKEQHLTQHERTHEVKQWECDICSKVFSTKYFLKKHKRLHTGEMPYTCATCGKSFTFQQSYHKHLLYHSDEKPHVCCDCGRAFKELSTLHNHQRIHTGEKPFACETCSKCFRQRVSYLVHRRIHTGVMPYKCTICNKSFRYKVSERTHKCNNSTPDHVVDKINDVVEKLQKMEQTNSSSKPELSVPISSTSGSSNATTSKSATSNEVTVENSLANLQKDNQCVKSVLGGQLEKLTCEKMGGNSPFWSGISKQSSTSDHRDASPDENIFSAESSDFLSFVLTPTFSPSEQFQNLTLSPDSVQNRRQGIADSEVETISSSVDRYQDGNFETINEQSLKELLDNVDVL